MITNEFKQLQDAAKRSGATTSKSAEDVAKALKNITKWPVEGR